MKPIKLKTKEQLISEGWKTKSCGDLIKYDVSLPIFECEFLFLGNVHTDYKFEEECLSLEANEHHLLPEECIDHTYNPEEYGGAGGAAGIVRFHGNTKNDTPIVKDHSARTVRQIKKEWEYKITPTDLGDDISVSLDGSFEIQYKGETKIYFSSGNIEKLYAFYKESWGADE